MTPLEVIAVGIGVVFISLIILTLSTYFFGWVINKYVVKGKEDEKEKVAAIVVAIQAGERD